MTLVATELRRLKDLRNVGKAALADFAVLGIKTVEDLLEADPVVLHERLCVLTGVRHDPCVEDVFAATIHQARTGEAKDWWAFTPARKARQAQGSKPGS
jgi:hypothetical protein